VVSGTEVRVLVKESDAKKIAIESHSDRLSMVCPFGGLKYV
jgi:hypothetical protein